MEEPQILLIDDQPSNLRVLLDYLQEAGFDMQVVRSGEAFIQQMKRKLPDLILLHATLPGMDGFETCRGLKENQHTKNIPVIFILTSNTLEEKLNVFHVGGADYITSPILQEEVLARVTASVTNQKFQQQLQEEKTLQALSKTSFEMAEEALAQERSLLRTLIDSMPDFIYVKDSEGRLLLANKAVIRSLGVDTLQELIGKTEIELFPGELTAQFSIAEQAVLDSGQPLINQEEPSKAKATGAQSWLLTTRVPFRDSQGKLAGLMGISRDITEHKQAEEKIRQQKELLESMIESITQPFYVVDVTDYRITIANSEARQLYNVSENTTCYTLAHRTSTPCDGIEHPCPMIEVKKTKKPVTVEHIHYDQDGNARNVEVHAYPILDHAGNVAQMIEYTLDITGRKQAEEYLRQLERAVETMPPGVTITDLDGKIIYMNPADVMMHGYRLEELLGQDAGILAPPEFRKSRSPDQVEDWKGLTRESLNIRKDNTIFPVSLISEVVKGANGEPSAIVTICEDITERKQAEKALREAEAKFRSIFENANAGIFQSTPDGKILSANPALAKIHGYDSPDEFLFSVTDIGKQLYVNPDDRKIFRRLLEEEGQLVDFEPQMYRKDGSVIWVSINARSVLDQQRQGQFYEGTLIDITARKRAEAEIRKYQGHLEDLVIERTSELTTSIKHLRQEVLERRRTEEALQHAKEAADSANQAKSEFLASMSHELRTPLNAILGYTQLLKTHTNLTKKERSAIETIHDSGEHLLAIINESLDLARIEARKMELKLTDFHLPGFLKNIVEIARIRAQQEGIFFVCETTFDLPAGVHADEIRLRQILLNLINNAIKFTTQGSVTFRVRCIGERQKVPGERKNKETFDLLPGTFNLLRFEVKDTGPGIPPEKLEGIFLPFHQAHDSRVHIEGTGLGLAISQQLAHMMGSELHVKSTSDQGSTFWFDLDLPVVQGVVTDKVEPARRIIGFTGEKRKILIVEDNQETHVVLNAMLAPVGFEIKYAVNGEEGFTKAATFCPDLILTDLMMPVMDGFEATRRIRQIPALKNVIVIGISASAFERTRRESLEAGCDDFLTKPFYIDELLKKLQTHLKLEWTYEEQHKIQTVEMPLEQRPIVLPPAEELAALYEWTVLGDIENIAEYMKKLEAANSAFAPFATKVWQLAEAFLLDELEEFLKQYLDC